VIELELSSAGSSGSSAMHADRIHTLAIKREIASHHP
jgi:hypothetical protein